MADTSMYIQEAASHVTSAAGQFERVVIELLGAFREGQFDAEPVGSPPYVRRLRDQAAKDLWVRDTSVSSMGAADAANSLVMALGYQPPGEPGKEG